MVETPPPRLLLFDDARARAWAPFSDSRPPGELLFGCATIRAHAERAFGRPCEGYLTGAALEGFDEPGSAPVVSAAGVGRNGTRILLSSRCALAAGPSRLPAGPARLVVDGHPVGWILPDGASLPGDATLLEPGPAGRDEASVELDGVVLEAPWDLVRRNPEAVARDVARLFEHSPVPSGVHVLGDGVISLAAGALIEPGVIVDTRAGPVRLAEGARVEGPARLVGPLFVGAGSTVFGGQVGTSSIGPACKVRGEIADCVLVGFSNKAHDGYLGHALVGRWVNLGAFTTNSDLKNNYGPVTVWTPDGPIDTGLMKVGCFLGDHVKTGIGTLLNTGTVIGTGSNVFGGAMPPTFVPPFSWGSGSELSDYRLDRFFQVAERAMGRRDQVLTEGMRMVLERAWHAAAALREAGRRPRGGDA